ncbi:MAG TPA: RES family NAD+ phosphorylase [Longimicrobiales bacterium]|nr:RES family NAD+ phosphorylase [Longimicrobiales bacterium]
MTAPPERVWRVFPWDPAAAEGERFSRSFVPRTQGHGRFDLPGAPGGVLYLAETAEHAVAEMIQHYRGQLLEEPDLYQGGYALALVEVTIPEPVRQAVADLCDPAVLLRLGIRPDETASGDRRVTQRIAATVQGHGCSGLRWWSALSGDWHTIVLFLERLAPPLAYETPESLGLDHPAVAEAARVLGIRRAGARA